MRSISGSLARRRSVTAVAGAALLVMAAAPVAAQVDTASATNGTIEACQSITVGTDGTGPGASAASTGQFWKCTGNASDERLQGDIDLIYNVAGWTGVGAIEWGWARISNDGGSWDGTWTSTVGEGQDQVIMAWYKGTGDYEGWTYVETQSGEYQADRETFGIVYPGAPPPVVVIEPFEPPGVEAAE